MEDRHYVESHLVRDAVITFVVVVLAVLALDDITTDSARSFSLERAALAGCAVWFLVIAWRLRRQGHRVLAMVSLGIVTSAALAQPTIGPDTAPMQIGYLLTVSALAWFLLLGGLLVVFAWRPAQRNAA